MLELSFAIFIASLISVLYFRYSIYNIDLVRARCAFFFKKSYFGAKSGFLVDSLSLALHDYY